MREMQRPSAQDIAGSFIKNELSPEKRIKNDVQNIVDRLNNPNSTFASQEEEIAFIHKNIVSHEGKELDVIWELRKHPGMKNKIEILNAAQERYIAGLPDKPEAVN